MDNVAFHSTKLVQRVYAAKGFRPVFTPPYSPWSNPIEMAFSKVKNTFRRATADDASEDGYVDRLLGSFELLDPGDCAAFFRHACRDVALATAALFSTQRAVLP
jgi:hypothetical protein